MIGLERSKTKKTSKKQKVIQKKKTNKQKHLNLTTRSWLYYKITHSG